MSSPRDYRSFFAVSLPGTSQPQRNHIMHIHKISSGVYSHTSASHHDNCTRMSIASSCPIVLG